MHSGSRAQAGLSVCSLRCYLRTKLLLCCRLIRFPFHTYERKKVVKYQFERQDHCEDLSTFLLGLVEPCCPWGSCTRLSHPIPPQPQPPPLFPGREHSVRVVSLWLPSPCFVQDDVCFLRRKAQSDVTLEEN